MTSEPIIATAIMAMPISRNILASRGLNAKRPLLYDRYPPEMPIMRKREKGERKMSKSDKAELPIHESPPPMESAKK